MFAQVFLFFILQNYRTLLNAHLLLQIETHKICVCVRKRPLNKLGMTMERERGGGRGRDLSMGSGQRDCIPSQHVKPTLTLCTRGDPEGHRRDLHTGERLPAGSRAKAEGGPHQVLREPGLPI